MKTYYVVFGSGDIRSNVGLSPTFLIFNNYGTAVTPPGITSVVGATGFYAFQWGTTTPIAFLIDGATTGLSSSARYISGSIDPADRSDEYGTTLVAIGNTSIQNQTNIGSTLVAIGNTSIAYGGTIQVVVNNIHQDVGTGNTIGTQTGITLVAIGNTIIAYGGTILQDVLNLGSTLVAIGNTAIIQGANLEGLIGTVGSTFGSSTTDPIDLFGYLKRIQENLEGDEKYIKTTGSLTIYNRGSSTTLASKTVTNGVTTVTKT